MPRDRITLNGVQYIVAKKSGSHVTKDVGTPVWTESQRPSQLGDPSSPQEAHWQTWGAQLNSFEELPETSSPAASIGLLSTDYTAGCDTRWEGNLTLGPQMTPVTLSTNDGVNVPGNTAAMTVAPATMNNTGPFLIVSRGKILVTLKCVDFTLSNKIIVLTEAATSLLYSKAGNGNEEISAGMLATKYEVITTIGNFNVAHTHSANSTNTIIRIFGQAPDRVAGLSGQTVTGNILTGSVTMASPSWNTVQTISGYNTTPTAFAMDGAFWALGTDYGVFELDGQSFQFIPISDQIAKAPFSGNCVGMGSFFDRVIYPTKNATRWLQYGQGASFGVENFLNNTSPVTGRVTARVATDRWEYEAIQNPLTTDTYLTAWRPRPGADGQFDPYVIARFPSTPVGAATWLGDGNTPSGLSTLVFGYGSNLVYFQEGQTARQIEDTNYRYGPYGVWWGTEMRRYPHMIKDLRFAELETTNNADSHQRMSLGFAQETTTGNWLETGTLISDGNAFHSPVSYWPLDETSGTTATDVKGSHNGTYNGTPTLAQPGLILNPAGDNGKSVLLDGSTQDISVAANAALNTTDFSFFVMIKPTSLPGSTAQIASKGNTDWALSYGTDGQFSFTGSGSSVTSGVYLAPGVPALVGVMYNGTTGVCQIFCNGQWMIAVQSVGTAANSSNHGLRFGSLNGASGYFPGTIEKPVLFTNDLSTTANVPYVYKMWSAFHGAHMLAGNITFNGTLGTNGAISAVTDSWQELAIIDDALSPLFWAAARRIKPVLFLERGVTETTAGATSTGVVGKLKLSYALRPLMTTTYRFTLWLENDPMTTAVEKKADVLSLWGEGPVTMAEDLFGEMYQVRVDSVSVTEVEDTGAGGEALAGGHIFVAELNTTLWPSLTDNALVGAS